MADPETALPDFFSRHLGLAGIVPSIFVLAAILSTLDSFTYNLVTTIRDDLPAGTYLRIRAGSRHTLAAGAVAFASLMVALVAESVLGLVLTALMIYVAVIGPGLVVRMFSKRRLPLWLPACVTLVTVLACGLAGVTVPGEPYSFVALHAVLIGGVAVVLPAVPDAPQGG
ncbi:MAG: hypothetical protein IPM24_03365 [Bryobacterales bacterium]|nr:hypothetical protein [Bryobacterales bacterium]